MSWNDLKWSIEDSSGAYEGLTQLESLDLSHNNIEAVERRALAPLLSLNLLDLSGNSITNLLDNPFQNMIGEFLLTCRDVKLSRMKIFALTILFSFIIKVRKPLRQSVPEYDW